MYINFACYLNLLIVLLPIPIHSLREQCCRDNGVPEVCLDVCNPTVVPNNTRRNDVFDRNSECQFFISKISKCLANGRDVSTCTERSVGENDRSKYCYPIFNGTMDYERRYHEHFDECWIDTVEHSFPCFNMSYSSSPTSPRNLEIVSKTETTADLKWDEPADHVDLVHGYLVYLVERTNNGTNEDLFETTETNFTLENLSPNSSYILYIRAHGVEFNGTKEWFTSQISNIVYFATGPGRLVASKVKRLPAIAKSTMMYCEMPTLWEAAYEIEWVKVVDDKLVPLPEGKKYSAVIMPKDDDTLYSALSINKWNDSDFGAYRCYINNTRIEYVETIITYYDYTEESPGDTPPDTAIECCEKEPQLPDCSATCQRVDVKLTEGAEKPAPTGFGGFGGFRRHHKSAVPLRNKWCKDATYQIMECARKPFNNGACCMHAMVPYHCIGMCDTDFTDGFFNPAICGHYMSAIFACQLDTREVLPDGFKNVKYESNWLSGGYITWDPNDGAKVYHVYMREGRREPWQSYVTMEPYIDVSSSVTKVAIVAVNEFGWASQQRLIRTRSGGMVNSEH